jgi:hypothetical protein
MKKSLFLVLFFFLNSTVPMGSFYGKIAEDFIKTCAFMCFAAGALTVGTVVVVYKVAKRSTKKSENSITSKNISFCKKDIT